MRKNTNARANYERGLYVPGKVQCLECGRWYNKVGAHVYNAHKMTAREYRERHNLPVKKGIVSDSLREKLQDNIKPNSIKTLLSAGKKYRFTPGTVPRYVRSPITTAERVAREKARAKIKDEDVPRIKQLRAQGMKLKDIAKVYGCSDSLVHKKLSQDGGSSS